MLLPLQTVVIGDPDATRRKIAALHAGGAHRLHIVADFDRTITTAFVRGEWRAVEAL